MTLRALVSHWGNLMSRKIDSTAWELLTKEALISLNNELNQAAVATKIATGSRPLHEVNVMENLIVDVWPAQQWGYLLNMYVALRSNASAMLSPWP